MKQTLFSLFFLTIAGVGAFAQQSNVDVVKTGNGNLTIRPIIHASLELSFAGNNILIDPSGDSTLFAGIKAPQMILLTDIHQDHFDKKLLAMVNTKNALIVAPQAVADSLPEALKKNLLVMKNGDNASQMNIAITAIPMYNLPESPTAFHPKSRGNGYILTIGGKRIYLSGDTQGTPEMRALKNIDIAFVCMNKPYTMDVTEAADAVLAFKPLIVYPYHYRGQDINTFKEQVNKEDPSIDVRLRNWYPAK